MITPDIFKTGLSEGTEPDQGAKRVGSFYRMFIGRIPPLSPTSGFQDNGHEQDMFSFDTTVDRSSLSSLSSWPISAKAKPHKYLFEGVLPSHESARFYLAARW